MKVNLTLLLVRNLIITILVFNSIAVLSQENNYWFHNYGSSSYLKGGIEVAGVRSSSAAYYNPAALSFLNGTYFEAQADVLSVDILNFENGAGDGISVDLLQLEAAPSFFAYTQKFKKQPKLSYALSIVTKSFSSFTFSVDHSFRDNLMLPDSREDYFSGIYDYYNRARETWFTGALSYLLTKNLSVGLSTNVTLRSQDFYRVYTAEVVPLDEFLSGSESFTKIALSNHSQRLNRRVLGLIFKPAISWEKDDLKLGATISTPNLSLGLLRNKSSRKYYELMPDLSSNANYKSVSLDYYSGEYQTPWIIEVGGEYSFSKVNIAASLAWFSAVDRYEMISRNENSSGYENLIPGEDAYAFPEMASKSIINVGIALTAQLMDHLYFATSVRTDFNHFDSSKLSRLTDYVPNMTFWDIYHLTTGIMLTGPRAELSIGVNYGLGLSEGDPQLVNMATAAQQNRLLGNISNNTSTQYHNIGFVLGFNYNINRIKGLTQENL